LENTFRDRRTGKRRAENLLVDAQSQVVTMGQEQQKVQFAKTNQVAERCLQNVTKIVCSLGNHPTLITLVTKHVTDLG
jgi:hypothetical protein